MFQCEYPKKKVLIQEIGETQDIMEIEGGEGGQSLSDQGLGKLNPQIDSQQKKDTKSNSKDLLRLEKNYFDKVYNEETHGNHKAFVVSKMMQQTPVKPHFTSLPVSSMKDRLNAFLPSFKKDTDDLLINPGRQDAMRIDDRNIYELEDKQQGNQESSDDDEVDENRIYDEENQQNKENVIDSEEMGQQAKTIQLDLLLGVLDANIPILEQADTKQ